MHARGLQLDFARVPPPQVPGWLSWIGRRLVELAPVFKVLFWGALAVGAVLIAWLVVRELLNLRRRPKRTAPTADWRPDAATAQALLEDADRLAAEGRYGEAVHLLLFRSIDDLAGRRPGAVRPALTSRDIAALPVMPQAARAAFARIAAAAERSVFGGRAVGAEDFRACREDYEAYAFSGAWS